jgi:AcrR family transcriptional regulator
MSATADASRADATRARLLEAATTAFAEKGFHGTTTRDIATLAGMSPAALYVHHKSKEELLYLISRSGHERTLALVEAAAASSEDPVEALRRLVHDFAADHAHTHTGARIVNYELAALSPEHLAEITEIRHRIQQQVHDLVERGIADGSFDVPDPRIAGVALVSLGIDIARWYREDGRWSAEDIGTRYAEIALRILGARTVRSG